MQLDEPGTYKPNVTVKKTAKPTSVEYGGEIEYTIEITNNGIVADEVIFRDDLAEGALAFVEVTRNTLGTQPDDMNGKTYLQVSNKITIDPGETKELKYKAKPSETAELGKIIKNTVTLYSYVNKDRVYDSASATTSVEKKVTIAPITNSENYNVIMILDHSNSMNMRKMKSMYSAVSKLLEENGTLYNLYTKTNMNLSIIHFNKSAKYKYEDISNKEGLKGPYKYYKNTNEFTTIFQGGTDYQEALNLAKSKLNNEFNNIIIFLTDGCPTPKLAIGTEYRIEKENEEYEYFKRTWSPGGIINKWRKDHSNTPIELWKNIANIATSIKQQNSEIYCISYGERDAEYGLKNVISSGEEYYELAEIENIEEKFNNIINNIKPLEIDTSPRYSQNGILTIEKPDKLKYIKVNGTPIEPKDLEKPIQDGKLDLTQFPIGATIELVY